MCLWQLWCFAGYFPYLLLLCMPLYGSFYGKESVLRLSILLYFYNAATTVFSRYRVCFQNILFYRSHIIIPVVYMSLCYQHIPVHVPVLSDSFRALDRNRITAHTPCCCDIRPLEFSDNRYRTCRSSSRPNL